MAATLLNIPSEIRNQIWDLVFRDQIVVPARTDRIIRHVGCLACLQGDHVEPVPWSEAYLPLLTCRQIHREAVETLQTSFTLHLGDNVFALLGLRTPYPTIIAHARYVALWVHIDEENQYLWRGALKSVGDMFPKIEHLTINAHMRPPNTYEVLINAVALAAPIVRYTRDNPAMKLTLHFDYTYEDIMFESPYLGEIRTTDALEEHELVVRDLIEDDAFIEAVLSQEEDEQTMVAALLRIARAHEQSWFEKLQRNRAARQRAQADTQAQPLSPSESQSSSMEALPASPEID